MSTLAPVIMLLLSLWSPGDFLFLQFVLVLLLNCNTINYYPTAQSRVHIKIEYKYPAILYIYLNSWLFCTVKNLFYQSAVCYLSLFALLFLPYEKQTERLSRTKSSWIINIL